ncbi:PRC-barrel domain-containing protein [Kineococcus sp. TBRC 1896]|uniref:PRC-barrel domain-containing protein n=1 Tax=Kineococcus mangrovi TaxID=1660183 RepID=A0ABV4I5M6_9ACTN
MTDQPTTLVRLDDTGRTVADPAADVRGRTVLNAEGEDLGKVDDLLVDLEGGFAEGRETAQETAQDDPQDDPQDGDGPDVQVRMLRVKHGGLLGIGAEVFFIPVDAVTSVDEDAVHVDLTRERVEGAPQYDPEIVDQSAYYQSLYGYYGVTPWEPGYVRPTWPVL